MAVTEKRPLDETVYSTKHIVMDIEGTTTSISFVKDTLFPYVRKNLDGYLSSHWEEDEFKGVLALLRDQAAEDTKAKMEGAVEIPSEASSDDIKAAVVKNVLWQMDADRKTGALKKLQGHMWRQGYKTGELKGHLFGDVAPALREWVKDGKKLYVYSSGSVEAQKLLFGNSTEGDLTELFTDFFDTGVGAKVEAESYKSILQKLDCNADDVLFLTDLPKEASAARQAGLPVVLVEREGNEPITGDLRKEFSAIASFQDVSFESSNKKQKIDSADDKEDIKLENGGLNGKSNGQSSEAMEVEVEDSHVSKAEVKEDGKPAATAEDMVVDEPTVKKVVDDASDSKENVPDAEKKSEEKPVEIIEENVVDVAEKPNVESSAVSKETDEPEVSSIAKETKIEEAHSVSGVTESVTEKPDETTTNSSEAVIDDSEKTDEKTPQLKTEEEAKVIPSKDSEIMETDLEKLTSKDDMKTDVVQGDKEDKDSKLVEPETDKKPEKIEKQDETIKEDKTEKGVKDDVVKENEVKELTEVVESDKNKTNEGNVSDLPKTEDTNLVPGEGETAKVEKQDGKEVSETGDHSGDSPSIEAEAQKSGIEDTKNKVTEAVEKKTEGDSEKEKDVNGDKEMNGVSNGTNGSSTGNDTDANGTVENGHGKEEKADVPEVIVAKNAPQMEKSAADGVVVEA